MFLGDRLTQYVLRSLKVGVITFAPESLELFRKQQIPSYKNGFILSSYFLPSSRLDLNRATGVKLSFPVQNFLLLTSYSCDDFCCSCCTALAFFVPVLCHSTKTFMYMWSGESRDIEGHLFPTPWGSVSSWETCAQMFYFTIPQVNTFMKRSGQAQWGP